MNLFKKLGNKHIQQSIQTEPYTVYQPVEGEVFPLKQLNDGVFSEGILGEGCAIKPTSQTVFSPFDGVISTVADTKHAIGVTSNDGIELLIHVGLDTVEMNGDGFKVFVKDGQKVKAFQPLLEFSIEKIKAHNYPTDVIVVVTNSSDYQKTEVFNTSNKSFAPLIKVVK